MKKNLYIITFLFLLIANITQAQNVYDKEIQKRLNGRKIEWNTSRDFTARVQHKKTKKWGMYQFTTDYVYNESTFEEEEILLIDTLIPPLYDNLSEFKYGELIFYDYEHEIVYASNKKKTGLLVFDYNGHQPLFNSIHFFDKVELISSQFAAILIDEKWGLFNWELNEVAIECTLNSKEEIPLNELGNWYTPENISKRSLGVDLIEHDYGNGDGVFRARNKETQKWGMFQNYGLNEIVELIPMQYDSVRFIPFNGAFSAVYNNGQVGIYLSKWSYEDKAKQTVECLYQDYQRFNVNNTTYLAVKKDNKWGWVDWLTGEEKSDFITSIKEQLPQPIFVQNSWIDE